MLIRKEDEDPVQGEDMLMGLVDKDNHIPINSEGMNEGEGRTKSQLSRKPKALHSYFPKGSFSSLQSPLIVFFSTIAILQVAYMLQGIFPYGKNTLMLIDMYHQYAPFMSEFQEKLKTGSSLLFSWSGGLGVNFLATVSYYLASPLNLLLVFFPTGYVTEAILVLTLIKVGLAAAFFQPWLRALSGKDDFSSLAFSMMYALSGYTLAYAWNIMWLDGVYLFPLLLLGLDLVIQKNKASLYILSLTCMFIFNFYISFFAIIFTVLYYPVMLERRKGFQGVKPVAILTLRIIVYSLIGLLLSCIVLIPTIHALALSSGSNDPFPNSVTLYQDVFDYFDRLFINSKPTVLSGMPNLYSGVIVLLLVPIFFLSSETTRWAKMYTGLLMIFLIASFNINILDYLWHGMHFPNQLPFRNAYVFIFLVVTIAYESFNKSAMISGRTVGILFVATIMILMLSQKLTDSDTQWPGYYMTAFFLLVYTIIFIVVPHASVKTFTRDLCIFIAIILELSANTLFVVNRINSENHYAPRDGYAIKGDVADLNETIRYIKNQENSFYRMEVLPVKTVNDPYLYHYQGLSIFSSMSAERTAKMMSRYGFHSNDVNSYKYAGSTLLLDSLLGIKYLVHRSGESHETLRTKVNTFGNVNVFLNEEALPIAYWAPSSITSWSSRGKTTIEAHEGLANALTGISGYFTNVPIPRMSAENATISSDGNGKFTVAYPDKNKQAIVKLYLDVDATETLYLQYKTSPIQFGIGNILIENKRIGFDSTRSTIIEAGQANAGSEVTIELWPNSHATGEYSFSMQAFALNENVFHKSIQKLKNGSMELESFSDSSIVGNITNENDGIIFTSIPYDEGWSVWIDGTKEPVRAVDEGFLAFDIMAGTHHIELRFFPKGLYAGIACSILGLLLFVYLLIYGRKNYRKHIQMNQINNASVGTIAENHEHIEQE